MAGATGWFWAGKKPAALAHLRNRRKVPSTGSLGELAFLWGLLGEREDEGRGETLLLLPERLMLVLRRREAPEAERDEERWSVEERLPPLTTCRRARRQGGRDSSLETREGPATNVGLCSGSPSSSTEAEAGSTEASTPGPLEGSQEHKDGGRTKLAVEQQGTSTRQAHLLPLYSRRKA